MEPWEFHPALVHFPIAFLLGAVIYDLYDWWRADLNANRPRIATGLLLAGTLTAALAALAGLVAFFHRAGIIYRRGRPLDLVAHRRGGDPVRAVCDCRRGTLVAPARAAIDLDAGCWTPRGRDPDLRGI
jgi:hypothetical protein